MTLACLILIISTALFLFYLQATCQRILQRKFAREYFLSIVNANRLEFQAVRNAMEEFNAPVDYSRFRMTLKCDFLALTYLLKNAANVNQRYSREERLMMLYFRAVFLSLVVRHLFRTGERAAILRLTSILEYFANVIGERVSLVRVGNLAPSDYLANL